MRVAPRLLLIALIASCFGVGAQTDPASIAAAMQNILPRLGTLWVPEVSGTLWVPEVSGTLLVPDAAMLRNASLSAISVPIGFRAAIEGLSPSIRPEPSQEASKEHSNIIELSATDMEAYKAALLAVAAGDIAQAKWHAAAAQNPILQKAVLSPSPTRSRQQGWLSEIGTLKAPAQHEARVATRSLKSPPPPNVKALGDKLGNLWRGNDPAAALLAFAQAEQNTEIPPLESGKALAGLLVRLLQQQQLSLAQNAAEMAMAAYEKAQMPPSPALLWFAGLAYAAAEDKASAPIAAGFFQLLSQQDALPDWDRAGAYFWQARTLALAGDKAGSVAAYQQAARYARTFYGLLAKSRLGLKAEFDWSEPPYTKTHQQILNQHAPASRALAWLQLGEGARAEAELWTLLSHQDAALQEAMLALALAEKMPALALALGGHMQNGQGEVIPAALYPLPAWEPVGGYQMPPALIFAMIQQESRFNPAARSRDGAAGVMQLLPKTAQHLAGAPASNLREYLANPEQNIALAEEYLQGLKADSAVRRDLIKLLAAYNAGPTQLRRWQQNLGAIKDPLLFMESLPSFETRQFIKRILAHMMIYEMRLQGATHLPHQLARREWPKLPPAPASLRLAAR